MFPCQTKTSLQFFLLNTDPRDAASLDELVVVFKKKQEQRPKRMEPQ